MSIPTEPVGSLPRPPELITAARAAREGRIDAAALEELYDAAVRDTVKRFEATGSPVVTDGEQRKYDSFWTYGVHGLPNLRPGGFELRFRRGHARVMPQLTSGPFVLHEYADAYVRSVRELTRRAIKQAVISPSALSLLYPPEGLPGYDREAFYDDVIREHVTEIRRCIAAGAHGVQIDFTEGRLAAKLDSTGELLAGFVDLNNLALEQLSAGERTRIGIHSCPGGDCDSTHSADVDYSELLPSLFELHATNFFLQLASEAEPRRVLEMIRRYRKPHQHVFIGVIDPLSPELETPGLVRDRVLLAAEYIPLDRLGTTDDCGFSPFCDDLSMSRDLAFAKIAARVEGTLLASQVLGVA